MIMHGQLDAAPLFDRTLCVYNCVFVFDVIMTIAIPISCVYNIILFIFFVRRRWALWYYVIAAHRVCVFNNIISYYIIRKAETPVS